MSLIATPPVDRLACARSSRRSTASRIREAVAARAVSRRPELLCLPAHRGPGAVAPNLRELVPEIRMAMAHGKLSPTTIENTMQDFVDGKFDVLLSTNIVESGLDISNANTMVIHRADMFGLAQLYQLRGRIGRGKTRAYAYLTVPPGKALNEAASKRPEVMQTLDTLGAGFQLASHDLDIRGAGNLWARNSRATSARSASSSTSSSSRRRSQRRAAGRRRRRGRLVADHQSRHPGADPEEYVADLSVRMGLYRRSAA
jgi:transcription-repair coupling factor (superfamily II helicase)